MSSKSLMWRLIYLKMYLNLFSLSLGSEKPDLEFEQDDPVVHLCA